MIQQKRLQLHQCKILHSEHSVPIHFKRPTALQEMLAAQEMKRSDKSATTELVRHWC